MKKASFLVFVIPTLPILPKNDWIRFNNSISLEWTPILKVNWTHQLEEFLGSLKVTEKQPSASMYPVTQNGFKELFLEDKGIIK